MRRSISLVLLLAGSAPVALHAQTAPAPAPNPAPPQPNPASAPQSDDDGADENDIVVTGSRSLPGAVVGDIPPEQSLGPADVRSYGVNSVSDLLNELGFTVLSPAWAKAEIVLGLTAVAAGIRLIPGEPAMAIAGGALFILGGYLAMAGHRSHLYQSMNKLTACILHRIGERDKPPV